MATKLGRLRKWLSSPPSIALLVVLLLITLAPGLRSRELRPLKIVFGPLAVDPSPSIEVIDVGDDPEAYAHLPGPELPHSPPDRCDIPRRAYAVLVRRLSEWEARAIVLTGLDLSTPCQAEDAQLAAALRESGNVIATARVTGERGQLRVREPVSPLGGAAWAVGIPTTSGVTDELRWLPLLVRDADTGRVHTAVALLAYYRMAGRQPPPMQAALDIVDGPGGAPRMLVDWYAPGATIRWHDLPDVLAMADNRGRGLFRGKAVIVGRRSRDEHRTVVGTMAGPDIEANALHTLLSGRAVPPLSPWPLRVLMFALALATSYVIYWARRFRSSLAIMLSVLAICSLLALASVATAVMLASQVAFQFAGAWLQLPPVRVGAAAQPIVEAHGQAAPVTWTSLTLVYTCLLFCAASILLSGIATYVAQSEKVAGTLGRLLPAFLDMRRSGLGDGDDVQSREASLLYSDIRNYTALSERLGPAKTLQLLRTYRAALEGIVASHGGTIAVTPGDAVLAVFWRDHRGSNHATCAVRAGKHILASIPTLAADWEAAGGALEVGIGINAGPVAVGFVGQRDLEATVIGDAVNVAQRLETLTQEIGYPMIVSRTAHALMQEEAGSVFLGTVDLAGRESAVEVYGIPEPESADGPTDPRTPGSGETAGRT